MFNNVVCFKKYIFQSKQHIQIFVFYLYFIKCVPDFVQSIWHCVLRYIKNSDKNAIVYHIWARSINQRTEGDTLLAEFKAEQRDPFCKHLRSTGLNSNDGTQLKEFNLWS